MSEWKSNIPEGLDLNRQYTPAQTEAQKKANRKRNKERWDQYNEEYRKAWGEKSSQSLKSYWDDLSEEEREKRIYLLQQVWDERDQAYRTEHGAKAQAWRKDEEKVRAYRDKKIEEGQWRNPLIYIQLYKETLSWKRFNNSNLYGNLSKKYNIPVATIEHIANNVTNLIDKKEHIANIDKIKNDWEKIKQQREKKKAEKSKEFWDEKCWFDIEVISPGKESSELYDYYNDQRTSNQKMPVKPSLIYFFREKNMKAKEIKEFCLKNKIYESNDITYWHKLAKFNYPWYSTEKSVRYTFSSMAEAAEFCSKQFGQKLNHQWIWEREKSGLQKFGAAKGWIIRKVMKNKQKETI